MKIALLVGLPFLVIFLVIGLLIMNAVRKKGNLRETGEDGKCPYEDNNIRIFVPV